MNIPNAQLKGVFFIHFILTTMALQHSWLPNSYLFYNFIFMIMLLWSIHHKESEEPVFMALVVNAVSILLDCIAIGISYNTGEVAGKIIGMANFRFSAAMSILNLLLRLVTCVLLFRLFNERCGFHSAFGIPGLSQDHSRYEDIDRPDPQIVPQSSMDTGSPGHSPIPTGSPHAQPHYH